VKHFLPYLELIPANVFDLPDILTPKTDLEIWSVVLDFGFDDRGFGILVLDSDFGRV
jgi:hypothetical protein